MKIVQMYDLQGKGKITNLTVEEMNVLVRHNNFTCLEENEFNEYIEGNMSLKEGLLDDLEMYTDPEMGCCDEEEILSLKSLIKKLEVLTEEQAKGLTVAIYKANQFFSMFYFIDPIEDIRKFEEKLNAYQELTKNHKIIQENQEKRIDNLNKMTEMQQQSIGNLMNVVQNVQMSIQKPTVLN